MFKKLFAFSGILMFLGLLLALLPLFMDQGAAVALWNSLLCGGFIIALARETPMALLCNRSSFTWALIFVGMWLISAPVILGFDHMAFLAMGTMALGFFVILLACWQGSLLSHFDVT